MRDRIKIEYALAASVHNPVNQIISILIRGNYRPRIYIGTGRAVLVDIKGLRCDIRGIVLINHADCHYRLVCQLTETVILNLNIQKIFILGFIIQISAFGHCDITSDSIHIEHSHSVSAKDCVGQIVSVRIRGLYRSHICAARTVLFDVEKLGCYLRGIVHVSQRDRHCGLVRQVPLTVILHLDIQRVFGCFLIVQISALSHCDPSGAGIHIEKSLAGSAHNPIGQTVSVRITRHGISHKGAARAVFLNREMLGINIRRFVLINHSDRHHRLICEVPVAVILNPDVQGIFRCGLVIDDSTRRHSDFPRLRIHLKHPLAGSASDGVGQIVPVHIICDNVAHRCAARAVLLNSEILVCNIGRFVQIIQMNCHCSMTGQVSLAVILNLDFQLIFVFGLIVQNSTLGHCDLAGGGIHVKQCAAASPDH